MSEEGRVSRVHGGVRIAGNHLGTSYRVRMCEAPAAKQAIGIAAARIVQSGTTILSIGGIEARQFVQQQSDIAGIAERIGRIDLKSAFPGRLCSAMICSNGMGLNGAQAR
ncbi:hypothetical protein ACLN6N_02810 [Sphingomonas carotinifaciens]|uniref:hypothetical protein n=1 Tax=Sphingomonas carotinifaciens TaxID=1166323 RepID=UPI0039A23A1A